MAHDTLTDARLRTWLLAGSVAKRAQELHTERSTVYRWLNGRTRPRGAMLALVLEKVGAWEAEQVERARATAREAPRAVGKPWGR